MSKFGLDEITVSAPPLAQPVKSVKQIQAMDDLFDFAYQIQLLRVQKSHPNLSSSEIHSKVMAVISDACGRW